MTAQDFCYWFRGMLEIAKPETLTKEQIEVINKHLDLVLTPVPRTQTPTSVSASVGIQAIQSERQRLGSLGKYCDTTGVSTVIATC